MGPSGRRSWGREAGLAAAVMAVLLVGVGVAEAASGDAAGTYTVTVTKIEVSTDGTNYLTVFNGSQAINVASADAGAVAASLVSGAALPPGTYTTVRVTIGATLSVKGYVNISGSTWFTSGGADSNAFTVNGGVTDTPGSTYAISTFAVPSANRTTTQSGLSFTVTAGGAGPTVRVAFDTSSVILNSGGTPTLGPPTVTMSSS